MTFVYGSLCRLIRKVQIRRQRPPSTNAYKRKQLPRRLKHYNFHQLSLSPQHLDLRSIKWRYPGELEAMEREILQ